MTVSVFVLCRSFQYFLDIIFSRFESTYYGQSHRKACAHFHMIINEHAMVKKTLYQINCVAHIKEEFVRKAKIKNKIDIKLNIQHSIAKGYRTFKRG